MSASLITEPKFEARDSENRIHKQAIAKKAVSLIKPGGSVFFDAGTTTTALAKIMPDIDIKIFTTAPNIALELMHLKIPTINLCGGSLNRANLALSGSFTLDMLEKINIDTAFLGVSGYDEMSGFTTGQESEAKVKSLVLKKSRTTVAMMDSTKVSRILPFTFGTLAEFTHVIVDGELSPEFVQKAAKCGVKII